MVDSPQQLYQCEVTPPYSVRLKLQGSYPLPGDFNISATLQDLPGPVIAATYSVTSAQVLPSLGRYHPFDGDGMVHRVRFENGAARYTRRYVRTEGFQAESEAGEALWGSSTERPDFTRKGAPFKNTANTATVRHNGRYFSLLEAAPPTEFDRDLRTLGECTFDGRLQGPMTAHPKVDSVTGDMLFFGYSPSAPYLRYSEVNAAGELVHSTEIDIPSPVMMHDFVITEHYAIFFDAPAIFDLHKMLQGGEPMSWQPDNGTRIGVLRRGSEGSQVRWFDIDNSYVVHFFNAWENGNNAALPVPKALFSHSDQIEQWQTAVPQGMQQLSGWAGRAADILHPSNTGATISMSISLGGNNTFQVGNNVQQFVITPSGALTFDGNTGGAAGNPLQIKNSALRSTLSQHYTNLLTESFSQLTKNGDDAQIYFQGKFDAADISAVDSLFPAQNYLAQTLKAAVKTIKIRSDLNLSRQTIFINYGGWDHHGELLNTQAGMLTTLDQAIGAYQQALEALGLANDVVTFTASDFGRTLRSNGRGTDHAWGGNAIVFGGPVDGGKIFGTFPDLTLDSNDDVGHGGRLLPSTSADAYFAEMLRWFGVPAGNMSYVLPNIANFWNVNSPTGPIGFIP